MPNKNHVVLEGHLGRDPELRYLASGEPFCTFSMAENYGKEGNRKTQWHNVVVWGSLAEATANTFKKGDAIHVEGPYRSRRWQDSEGATRETWEVTAWTVCRPIFAGDRNRKAESVDDGIDDDQIPF